MKATGPAVPRELEEACADFRGQFPLDDMSSSHAQFHRSAWELTVLANAQSRLSSASLAVACPETLTF